MLKPVDSGPAPSERPVGELVHQLIEEGKAYARAEVGLVRALAAAKGKALALPAALFGLAFILALAAVTALAVGVVMALAKFIGPLAAGFVGMLIFLAFAGTCGWVGYQRLRRDL
jgi:hypothetical protein